MPKLKKPLDPVADKLLLSFAEKMLKENRFDKATASQLEKMIKEFRTASKDKLKTFMKRVAPNVRYIIKKEYNKFVKGGYAKTNPTLASYRLNDLKPKFRKELDDAVKNSLSMIKTQNEQTTLKLEQRFRNWMIVPTKEMRSAQGIAERITKKNEAARSADKHIKFVVKDQYRKMIGSMDEITAKENQAIGLVWMTRKDNRVVGKPGGLYPVVKQPQVHGDHYDREGVFYLLRDTWAIKKGFVVPRDGVIYLDALPDGRPSEPIGCRCLGSNIYSLDKIPNKYRGCLTKKGLDFIKK